MNGFVNILKPSGMSSNAVVSVVRKHFGGEKTGHLGTLDPLAAGVLPIAVGKATKLFNLLLNKQKSYRAFFTFGVTTDTLDSEGVIVEKQPFSKSVNEINVALLSLTGMQNQIPPSYSAKSVGGVRAYKLARQGNAPDLPPKQVQIHDFKLVRQTAENTFCFDICCSSGTYIRSLARDLAEKLDTVGYMSALIRLNSGEFSIDEAKTIDEVAICPEKALLPLDFPLKNLPTWNVDESYLKQLSNGVKISWLPENGEYHQIKCGGVLLGVGKNSNKVLDMEFYLK